MKIHILAVGKIHERFYADGIAEYLKRASRWAEVRVTEVDDFAVKENGSGARTLAMEREADKLLPLVKGFCVALDIDGQLIDNAQLATTLQGGLLRFGGEASFVIGGSYGLSPRVKERADFKLSFGRVTFPHQMVRLMTTEQVYRSLTILNGHPYHK